MPHERVAAMKVAMAERAILGRSTGFTLAWQHLDAARNVETSAAIMRGDPEPIRKMLDALVRDGT